MDVNWGEAPHDLDTGLGSRSARMHAMLSSGRGCSQVLLLGILSRHVHSITQRGVGATCLTDMLYKGKVVAAMEIRWKYEQVENISYVRCVHLPWLWVLDVRLSGCETSPLVSRDTLDTPSTWLPLETTKGSKCRTTVQKPSPNTPRRLGFWAGWHVRLTRGCREAPNHFKKTWTMTSLKAAPDGGRCWDVCESDNTSKIWCLLGPLQTRKDTMYMIEALYTWGCCHAIATRAERNFGRNPGHECKVPILLRPSFLQWRPSTIESLFIEGDKRVLVERAW